MHSQLQSLLTTMNLICRLTTDMFSVKKDLVSPAAPYCPAAFGLRNEGDADLLFPAQENQNAFNAVVIKFSSTRNLDAAVAEVCSEIQDAVRYFDYNAKLITADSSFEDPGGDKAKERQNEHGRKQWGKVADLMREVCIGNYMYLWCTSPETCGSRGPG